MKKVQRKYREFDCLTGHSVLFLCYLKLISFLLFETKFVFMLFAQCYLVRNPSLQRL